MTTLGQDAIDEAGRQIAPGPPSTIIESLSSASALSRATNTMLGPPGSIHAEYERYRADIGRITSNRLFNPFSFGVKDRAKQERRFLAEVTRLREQHPNLEIRTGQDIRATVARQRASSGPVTAWRTWCANCSARRPATLTPRQWPRV